MTPINSPIRTWIAAGLFLVMFVLATTSMMSESPTYDEQGFLVRGVAYLRGEDAGGSRRIRVGHPLGLNALNGALLARDSSVRLPSDDPSWQGTSFHRPAERFLWEIGNDVTHIIFLGRLPTIWLGLLMAAVSARWATQLGLQWGIEHPSRSDSTKRRSAWPTLGGLITLCLIAFDPNILAHMRLATTDLGLTAAAILAGYTLWLFLKSPKLSVAVLAGISLGLLQNTKFTALIFLPLFAIVILIDLWQGYRSGNRKPKWFFVMILVIYPLSAFLALWATNGFQTGPIQSFIPILGQLGGWPVPLSNHLDQLLDIGNRLQVSTPAFLLGRYSDSGWWYYFPVAFLLKTPMAVLILIGWALIHVVIRSRSYPALDLAALLVPPIGYFAIALTTDINLGYRHILPILPFLYVFTGSVLGQFLPGTFDEATRIVQQRRKRGAVVALLLWLVIVSVWIYPHYLAFFNLLAGGPNNGWRYLVDSNLDWGQDLGNLKRWLEDNNVDQTLLSYFGEGRPEFYGINYIGLDSFPPRLMNPDARPFYPYNPAPGIYAISATNLQGVHFADHNQFEFFRQREPLDKVGYSIFLFDQPAIGQPVNLLLGNIQVVELLPDDYAQFRTNDVELRWFDANQAILLPSNDKPIWLALKNDVPLNPLLDPLVNKMSSGSVENEVYELYQVNSEHRDAPDNIILLQHNDGKIAYTGSPLVTVDGQGLTVITTWQQEGDPQPVKIFIHVLDEGDEIVAQWDGLGVAWEGWRNGDKLVQVHELRLPEGLPSGSYRLVAGLYHPDTIQRWSSSTGADVIELGEIIKP